MQRLLAVLALLLGGLAAEAAHPVECRLATDTLSGRVRRPEDQSEECGPVG